MWDKIIRWVSFIFFGMAVWLIFKEVHHVGADYLGRLILETPMGIIALALVFVFADYCALVGYDKIALDYVGKCVSNLTMIEAAGIGFAVSNTAGHAYLTGGAIRYLFYVPAGLTKGQVLELIAFETLTIFMGMALAYVIAVGLAPFEAVLGSYPHIGWLYGTAVAVSVGLLVYWVFIVRRHQNISIGGRMIQAPSERMTIRQFGVGLLDNIFIFLCFYVLLRYHVGAPIILSFVVFMIAQTVGLTSQVPGGIGVFEGLFLLLYPYTPDQKSGILASLVVFRALYFFMPFVVASAYLGIRGLNRRQQRLKGRCPYSTEVGQSTTKVPQNEALRK